MAEIQKDIELKQGMSKKTKIIMIIGIVVLLSIIWAGVYWWLSKDAASDESTEDAEVEVQKATPVYHEVTAPFIVNFSEQSNDRVRYLQIKMKVMARDQASIDLFALQNETAQRLYSRHRWKPLIVSLNSRIVMSPGLKPFISPVW